MSTQTVPQNAIVNAVKGEVLVLGLDGKVRSIKAGGMS
ncbi:RTX toxin and related Ca2+-binding protein [Vibrio sp. JCM 18905]|nr:RTX toxin and related Ca2+-binding protein [Vibrio sp. JCM 18905]